MKKVSLLLLPVVALLRDGRRSLFSGHPHTWTLHLWLHGQERKIGNPLPVPTRHAVFRGLLPCPSHRKRSLSSFEKGRGSGQGIVRRNPGKASGATSIRPAHKSFSGAIHDLASPFSDGLALVQRPGERELSYIDHNGKVVLTVSHRYAHNFSEGLAVVVGDRGRNGYINKSGQMVIEPQVLSQGEAISRRIGGCGSRQEMGFHQQVWRSWPSPFSSIKHHHSPMALRQCG